MTHPATPTGASMLPRPSDEVVCMKADAFTKMVLAIESESAQQERERLAPWLRHHSDCHYLDGSKCRCGLVAEA